MGAIHPNDALYLYCLADSRRIDSLEGRGLNDAPLDLRKVGGMAVVISRVSRAEFCGEEAEERIRDINWLGPRVYRHETVIEDIMRKSPVLPMPFGTLFSSFGTLEVFLAKHSLEISEFLVRTEGKDEWAVKGCLDREAALFAVRDVAEGRECAQPSSSGSNYLLERRLRRDAEEKLSSWLSEVSKAVGSDLNRYAVGFRKRKVSEEDDSAIINWAFLIPREATSLFREQILRSNAKFADQGVTFECTGPWPPYSFVPPLGKEEGI